MKTIVIGNQKGGAGKTTTAAAIAQGLALRARHVLFIDTDPQCDASIACCVPSGATPNIADVLAHEATITDAVRSVPKVPGLDFVPSSLILNTAGINLNAFRAILAPLAAQYDYCIIDTPPAVSTLTFATLNAADFVIIPTTADKFGIEAVSKMAATVENVRANYKKDLRIMGVVLVQFNKQSALHKLVADGFPVMLEHSGATLFNTRIRRAQAVQDAQATKESIYTYAPRSGVVEDYTALCIEVEERAQR